jgi:uncharacterized membrane protein YfcA
VALALAAGIIGFAKTAIGGAAAVAVVLFAAVYPARESILAGLLMLGMLGTGAWSFLSVNLAKVPLSAGLGLISWSSLAMDALLVPAMLLGGLVGALTVRRIGQRTFELAALGLGLVTALLLVVDT